MMLINNNRRQTKSNCQDFDSNDKGTYEGSENHFAVVIPVLIKYVSFTMHSHITTNLQIRLLKLKLD